MIDFKIVIMLFLFLFFYKLTYSQCSSGLTFITSTDTSQTINSINISISSPTNAQSTRVSFGSVNGYYIGDKNATEEILFTLNKPVTQIRITGRALSAVTRYNKIEFFTLEINGEHHVVQPNELITPDPIYGRQCFLQGNGSILGDTIPDGDGSFVFTYIALTNSPGVTSFKIKDSIATLGDPAGAIFDVEIYSKCQSDTSINTNRNKFFIPNAFTPNNDGKNDFFKPIIFGNIKQYKFFIYNRWGQTIFHTNEFSKGWDGNFSGKNQDSNVFIWRCIYQFEGEPFKEQKGTVILIK
jgi:gliding motility-associated-like protein